MNTDKVTRFEVIDHRNCPGCAGTGMRHDAGVPVEPCGECGGLGCQGRVMVEHGLTVEILPLQDNDRTLKIRLIDREDQS